MQFDFTKESLVQFLIDAPIGLREKFERTQTGGIKIPARIAKAGVVTYKTPYGDRREYRDPSELFSQKSMDLYRNIPVTVDHPKTNGGRVDTRNYKRYSVGHIDTDIRRDGDYLTSYLIVEDENAIKMIENGELKEISTGYQRRMDPIEGVTDSGESYHLVQRDIRPNHVALGPSGWGRAGSDVSLVLDSNGFCSIVLNENTFSEKTDSEKKESENKTEVEKVKHEMKIDGIPYEFETSDSSFKNAIDKELSSKQLVLDSLEAENKSLKEEIEKIKSQNEQLVKDSLSPEEFQKRVQSRVALERKAVEVIGTEKDLTPLSDKEIMLSVLGEDFNSDGKDESFIRGAFELKVSSKPKQSQTQPLSRMDQAIINSRTRMVNDSNRQDGESPLARAIRGYEERSRGL